MATGKTRAPRRGRWWVPPAVVAMVLAVLAPGLAHANQQAGADDKRALALDLYRKHKNLEALPLFEELAAANPSDALVEEGLGVCLLSHAATLADPEMRRLEVKRSRAALGRAKELGDTSEIVRVLLEMTPVDGNIPVFSGREDVDNAMREGEAAFARRDLDAAITAYKRAMLLDPRLYEAPLFVGDSYFAKKDYENAESWFAVAVSVDPDKETAYRYWGDALLAEKKVEEAHAKYIEAIIDSPYSQATWVGLSHWAHALGGTLAQPRIESPNKQTGESGKVTITVNPSSLNKNDGSSAWLLYDITRAAWKQNLFQQKYPDAKEYRHSLAEESAALGVVASNAREAQKKDPPQLDPALKTLIELVDKGLLQAYILLAKADDGIAQDYPPYRAEHRAELRRYLKEYVGVLKK